MTCSGALAADQVEKIYNDLNNIDQKFFESAVIPDPDVKVENSDEQQYSEDQPKTEKHMPLFKKTRLKIQKAWSDRGKRIEAKRLQKEAEQSDIERGESEIKDDIDMEMQEMEETFGFDNHYSASLSDIKKQNKEESSTHIFQISRKKDKTDETLELTGGVKEQATENEMVLDCENVIFNEKTGDIEAVGNPVLNFPPQKVQLSADKMIYNRDSNILKAIGNVVLTRDSVPVQGDYIQVNMNEENIFMDNVSLETATMKIRAKKAESDNNQLVLSNGNMHSEQSQKFRFVSRVAGPNFIDMIIDEKDKNEFLSGENAKFKISASEIFIDAQKDHDRVQMKEGEVYYNDKYLFTLPSFTAHTNKEQEYFEANYPELGAISKFGMFAGPGFVFDTPFGSVLKLIPLLNYKDELGFGGAVKYRTAFNQTYAMYGSGSDIFMFKGKQELDDNLYLQYGSNAYLNEWFLGRRMPKYLAELVYEKGRTINDFLVEGKPLNFRHRASAAFAEDGKYNMHSENLAATGTSTTRFRYMAQADMPFYRYKDKAKRKALDISLVMQGSAALYGTGDTQFIGRIGPRIHTQYKYWMQDIGYFQSAYDDQTPMPVYDTYRYGNSNVYIREAFRINKYLSVGWSGSLTLTGDSPNGEIFQENAFIFSLGPDDLKLNLGYDFMRQTTYFSIALSLDSKSSEVEFDKMVIKNPERVGQSDSSDDSVAFEQSSAALNTAAKRYEYAQVINIEDPSKESI